MVPSRNPPFFTFLTVAHCTANKPLRPEPSIVHHHAFSDFGFGLEPDKLREYPSIHGDLPCTKRIQGPLTTTYTAPSSCSTLLGDIEIAISTTDFDTNSTVIGLWGEPCGETIATVGSCLPSGAKMDSIMSTLDTNNPQAGYTVEYFSPGLVCPSGWETAGVATKVDGGSITSSGPGFVDPYPTSSFDVNFLENFSPNVLLAGMAEGETAILCCPT